MNDEESIEKCQLYLAIGMFMLGSYFEVNSLVGLSAGIFLGMSAAYLYKWRLYKEDK